MHFHDLRSMTNRETRIGNPQARKLFAKCRFIADKNDLDARLTDGLQRPFENRGRTVVPAHGINGYAHSIHSCVPREDAQKWQPTRPQGVWVPSRSGATLRRTNDRERSWGPFSASSTFLDSDDVHSFVCPAIQASVMGKFRLMTLRANGRARRRDPHLLGSPLVSTCSGYFMFRIWHCLPRSSVSLVLIRLR